ncbi:hypothetical protein Nit79A3_1530 [Nitrosomonas sp. Is79A3]
MNSQRLNTRTIPGFLLPLIIHQLGNHKNSSDSNSSRSSNRPLKNVFEVADARQKQAKKRNLCLINEHFESVFNTAAATQIVLQRPVRVSGITAHWNCYQNYAKSIAGFGRCPTYREIVNSMCCEDIRIIQIPAIKNYRVS